MAQRDLPEHVRALLRRDAYPHPPTHIELVQTHSAYVFLLDDEVFKLKKAVDLGFLDFTTLEKRRIDCEEEVRLNRRGCSTAYLGVETVTLTDGHYRIGGDGEVVDYAVHMRRLPADGMMDKALARAEVTLSVIGRLVVRIVAMHEEAERSERISAIGSYETMWGNWRETLDALDGFAGKTLNRGAFERVRAYAEAFARDEEGLLRGRAAAGWVRDCHGDLRTDAICFDPESPDGVCLYDCIEFNERFRYIDTGLDIAFLSMDLDYRGESVLSDLLIGLYAAAIGDAELPLLLRFYKAYRACVRAKVDSLLAAQPGVSKRDAAAARGRAHRYLRLADAYAREGVATAPRTVLLMGASGSGKSVLAGMLASRLGAVLLSTDLMRRELVPETRTTWRTQSADTGRFAPEARLQIYEALAGRAEVYINAGRWVVIDGTFIEAAQRQLIIEAAGRAGARLTLVECSAPDAVVRERQQARASEAWSTSEGRWEVYLAQKQRYEAPSEVPESARVVVDTTGPLADQLERALNAIRGSADP